MRQIFCTYIIIFLCCTNIIFRKYINFNCCTYMILKIYIKGPQFILWTGCSVAECAAESLRGYGDLNEICCCGSIIEGKNRYFWSIIKGLVLKHNQRTCFTLYWLFGSTKSGHFGTFFHFLTLIRHVKSYQKIKLTLVYRPFSPKKWPELDNFFHFTLYWWLH